MLWVNSCDLMLAITHVVEWVLPAVTPSLLSFVDAVAVFSCLDPKNDVLNRFSLLSLGPVSLWVLMSCIILSVLRLSPATVKARSLSS